MPNYETHLLAGATVGVGGGVATFGMFEPVVPYDFAVFAGVITWEAICVGSIFPDIDHQDSKPRQLLNGGLVLSMGLVVYLSVLFRSGTGIDAHGGWHLLGGFLGLVSIGITGRFIPQLVDAVMPKHRGMLHFLPIYGILFYFPAWALWTQKITIPGIHPAYEVIFIAPVLAGIFVGTCIHVFLDTSSVVNQEIERWRRYG